MTNSSLCELKAGILMLESFAPLAAACRVGHRSDNQASGSIIQIGSRLANLYEVAMKIFRICFSHKIARKTEWIPREANERAGFLSKLVDTGGWQVLAHLFNPLET